MLFLQLTDSYFSDRLARRGHSLDPSVRTRPDDPDGVCTLRIVARVGARSLRRHGIGIHAGLDRRARDHQRNVGIVVVRVPWVVLRWPHPERLEDEFRDRRALHVETADDPAADAIVADVAAQELVAV